MFEEQLLGELLQRNNLNIKYSYTKVLHNYEAKNLVDNILNLQHNQLNVIVYNFMVRNHQIFVGNLILPILRRLQ